MTTTDAFSTSEELSSSIRKGIRTPLDRPIHALSKRFGGSRSRAMEQFLRFAVVGVSGAIIDLGLVYLLQWSVLPPTTGTQVGIVAVIASTCAVISNFVWTRYWVYPEARSNSFQKQFAMFVIISIIGLVFRFIWAQTAAIPIGAILLPIALPFIQIIRPGYIPGPLAGNKLGSLAAQMIAMVVVMFWNFFANRRWTYSDAK
jgi:putative flippase GtrA